MRAKAIIVAAKAPVAGRAKTRLISAGLTAEDAARVAGSALADTLANASHPELRADLHLALEGDSSDLPANLFNPTHVDTTERIVLTSVFPQSGNSLGERLVRIFGWGFDAGYRSVCVIGSDAPHLPSAFITDAFGRLENAAADVVLGPADDGGYYLIALRAEGRDRHPALFDDGMPWSTSGVLTATRERADEAGLRLVLLPAWYDVDTPGDLARLRTDLRRGVAFAPRTRTTLETLGPELKS
jgi:hypothetical protein